MEVSIVDVCVAMFLVCLLPSLLYYYARSNLTQEIVILGIYYESNLAQVRH